MEIIYAIPGLGTTKELFRNIVIPNHRLIVLTWPTPLPNSTLKEYAKQFLSQIDATYPVSLIGVSFGGMLCSELADQIKTKKVILISSCKDSTEFPLLLKGLKFVPLYKLIPDRAIHFVSEIKKKSKSPNAILYEMMCEMKENYFSSCIDYIIKWDKKEHKSNLIHIHGTADRLLTFKQIKNCYSITGGSHTMILDRSKEINEILNKELNGL